MIKGNLKEFSLSELFQIIAQDVKTGLLVIKTTEHQSAWRKHYIWFNKGLIIAAANSLDGKCLVSLIRRRSWIKTDKEEQEILNKFNYISNTALGLYLKWKNVLTDHDIDFIFRIQIMREVNPLFELKEADFLFQEGLSLPFYEMTGLSISAKELLLKGLRGLRDWSILLKKLPYATSTLGINKNVKLDVILDVYESKIWNLMESNLSLVEIARKLTLTIEKVQQTAFCLIMVGLAEEIPYLNPASLSSLNSDFDKVSSNKKTTLSPVNLVLDKVSSNKQTTLSDHFLSNLTNFLHK